MPEGRPSIPVEIQRQLLFEAGHRCAVCGAELPLERAHIKPWSRSRDHSLDNLICLCANCHQRADREGWGEEALRQYKQNPWVLRSRSPRVGSATVAAPAFRQLPAPPADFIGRGTELAELRAAVVGSGSALLGIRGMGGIGKTALALKLAEGLAEAYSDAHIYFDLKGLSSRPPLPWEAMAHVIHSLRPEVQLPDGDDAMAGLYRSLLHGLRALLMFENARDAAQLEPLLPPPGSLLVFTSRNRFHLPGLYAKDLGEMPPDASEHLLLRIEPRIGGQAEAVAQICAGLPFALRQAAATLGARPDLSPAAYVAQLNERTRRSGLVEAALDLSLGLLEEPSTSRWRSLAIFPAVFSLPAASDVWDIAGSEAERLLADLIGRNLIQGVDERYWLHDLARDLADSQLTDDARKAAESRFSQHYLLYTAGCASSFMEGAELEALCALDREWGNIKEGFVHALRASADDPVAARCAVGYPVVCQPFLHLRFHPQEALHWLEGTLPLAREQNDDLFTATILNSMGLTLGHAGRYTEAIPRLNEALALAVQRENSHLEETILGNLGNALVFVGRLEEARIALERALSLAEGVHDPNGRVVAVAGLERLYFNLGDHRRALELGHQWLTASRQLNQRHSESQALGNIGITLMHLDEPRKAVESFEANLSIARELGDLSGQAAALGNLGWALAVLGDPRRAAHFLQSRIALSESIGDARGVAESSWALGNLCEESGDLDRAAALMQIYADYLQRILHPRAVEIAAELDALRLRIKETAALVRPPNPTDPSSRP